MRRIVLATMAIAASTSASAQGLPGLGAPPRDIGATVAGFPTVTTPGGLIATGRGVTSANKWVADTLGSQIMQVGRAITDGQSKQIAAEAKIQDGIAETLSNVAREEFKADRSAEKREVYGPLSRSSGACQSVSLGDGIARGNAAQGGVSGKIKVEQASYNTGMSRPSEIRDRLSGLEEEDVDPNSLVPDNNTIEDKEHAINYVETMINPRPQLELSDEAKKTAAGENYEAARKTAETRRGPAEALARETMRLNLPTIPLGDWASDRWREAGHSSPPDSVKDGRISPMALNKLIVDLRSGNPNWYADVNGRMNTTALMRELVVMKAQSMRMRYQQMRLQMRLATLMTSTESQKLEQANSAELSELRNAAMRSGVR